MKLRVLDLFSGIGGFSLGLERTGGFETVAFCEIEEFPRKVLAKHWPKVPIYHDVRELTADRLRADGIGVDVICGGFPCQDISSSGNGQGLGGERSGLWYQYARLIGELRPQFVVVENVAALLHRGLDAVLGSLAAIGYNAEWRCIRAAFVGLPQLRNRVWIVAYPQSKRPQAVFEQLCILHAAREAHLRLARCGGSIYTADSERDVWTVEPGVVRVADGVPNRMDRIHGLGNAVVPQIPELIGNAILQSMRQAA
jgi:DNA (cytosine-5)-methyltransferase 1